MEEYKEAGSIKATAGRLESVISGEVRGALCVRHGEKSEDFKVLLD